MEWKEECYFRTLWIGLQKKSVMYVHTIVVLPHNLSELTSVGHIIASLYFYAIVFFTTNIYEKQTFIP